MRIREEINHAGYFWLPSEPDNKIPGHLVIKNGGKIELEIVGVFGTKKSSKALEEFSRINGEIEKFGNVTLDDCFYKIKNRSFGGICKSKIIINIAYIGIAFEENREILFENISFDIDNIDEWLGLSGIQISTDKITGAPTITYTPPEAIKLDISEGLKIHFSFAYTFPHSGFQTEAKITQRARINLLFNTALNIDNASTIIHRVTNFFNFAIGETVSIGNLIGRSSEYQVAYSKSKRREIPVRVVYEASPFTELAMPATNHEMVLSFGEVAHEIESIIRNWIVAYENLAPALDLYFSVKNGGHKHQEPKFLALAQGLETYHRRTSNEKLMNQEEYDVLVQQILIGCPDEKKEWLLAGLKYGNEINLRKRLADLIKPYGALFGNSRARSSLVSKITDTRNYLTHYSKDLEANSADGFELLELCNKMQVIFYLQLLSIVGCSEEKIISMVKGKMYFRRMLRTEA